MEQARRIPVIVDLYAPRLLENLYETDDGEVSHQLLRAIDRADAYLIAHEAQRDHVQASHAGVGVQEVKTRTLIVPLGLESASNTPPKGNPCRWRTHLALAKPLEQSPYFIDRFG